MGASFGQNLAHSRKEATRRQRIEAEQRRRDELRDGYAKLKEVLPISNQKSSKVSLLERGLSWRLLIISVSDRYCCSHKPHRQPRTHDVRDASPSHSSGAGGEEAACDQ